MLLGIDVGTSAIKVVLSDGATILRTGEAALTRQSPHAGWSEQDPAAWWAGTRAALATLGDLSGVRAVGLSGQMHGAVLLGAGHKVLRPAILWNDNRSVAECATLRERLPDIGQRAGVLPLPGFTAPKLIWLKAHEPEIYAQVRHILLPKDYVGLCLHGELATDMSDAAGTLWLDQQGRAWSDTLCTASDTDPAWLPALHYGTDQCGAVTARAAEATGLRAGTLVFAGGGDAATGAASLGATEAGRGFISLGTSGQLFIAGDTYRPNPDAFVHAFAHTVPGRWYQMAALLNGARPLAWLAGLLEMPVADMLAAAQTADATRAPVFLPYLTGERSPHGDPQVRASFALLDDTTTRAELALAVVEAIAFSFDDAVQSFGSSIDSVPHFLAIGGGSRSDFLLQKIADATGQTLHRQANASAGSAAGAAFLAGMGLGEAINADPTDEATVFAPAPDDGLAARKEKFRALYGLIGKGRL